MQHFFVEATSPLPAGEHQVRMEFDYAGEGLGKGGTVTLYTDRTPAHPSRLTMARAATLLTAGSWVYRSRSPMPPRLAVR